MSRIQLALNVSNLDEAVVFYSKLFKSAPAKVRPGYANFAIDEPPLKLVLIEGGGEPGSLNHLGVEVFSVEEVKEATTYFTANDVATTVEVQTTCCYAVQDKVWVDGPDNTRWEVYTVLGDAPTMSEPSIDSCCASSESVSLGAAADTPATSCC